MANLYGPIVVERNDLRLVRHDDMQLARLEAERLAKLNPGKEFAVYMPIIFYISPVSPVRATQIHNGREIDIPF